MGNREQRTTSTTESTDKADRIAYTPQTEDTAFKIAMGLLAARPYEPVYEPVKEEDMGNQEKVMVVLMLESGKELSGYMTKPEAFNALARWQRWEEHNTPLKIQVEFIDRSASEFHIKYSSVVAMGFREV